MLDFAFSFIIKTLNIITSSCTFKIRNLIERRKNIWILIIKAIDSISKNSKFKEVGMNQIFSFIKGFQFPFSDIIDTKSISAEEIFLALTENSDCVELFQFESITQNDIFFSLRETPEKSIQKAKKMQQHGINEILNQIDIYSTKGLPSHKNENSKTVHNSLTT